MSLSWPAPLALIGASRRPVLIAGHGARHATGQLRALAERLSAAVLTTFKAKGLILDTHPLGAGVLGCSRTPVASWLMNEADLLIAVGASFPCRWLGFWVMAGRWGGRGGWWRFRR